MKIRPVGAELFHANGRTDITSSEHTRTHTNNRLANLKQPQIQYTQREVRQYTDIHNP